MLTGKVPNIGTSMRAAALVIGAFFFGCGASPPPPRPAASVVVVALPDVPKLVTDAPLARGPIKLHPIVGLATLGGVTLSGSHVELRVGFFDGGTVADGPYWFMPVSDGQPDLARQSPLVDIVPTEQGILELYGHRPDLQLHVVSGFQEIPADHYVSLAGAAGDTAFSPISDFKTGNGIYKWSDGRLLEWRSEALLGLGPAVPIFRVASKQYHAVPTIPKALDAQLEQREFMVKDMIVSPTGMVMVIGVGRGDGKITTLLWGRELHDPVVVEQPDDFLGRESNIQFLGGMTRDNTYVLIDEDIMRLKRSGWEKVGRYEDAPPSNMWFGEPRVVRLKKGWFARLAENAPWRPILAPDDPEGHYDFVIDSNGVIWTHDGDVLLSSEPPTQPYRVIALSEIFAARRAAKLEVPKVPRNYE